MTNIDALKSVIGGPTSMKANAALAFILAGSALRLLETERATLRARRIGRATALAVAGIGLLTLGEYLLGSNLHIDQLLVRGIPDAVVTAPLGRMAPATAGSFVLVGIALLLIDARGRHRRRAGQALTLTAALISWQVLLGHAYGVTLYTIPAYRYAGVALYDAVAFTLLCTGLLASRPHHGVMALLTSTSAGGYTARRLLPAAIGVPSFLGWLVLTGERAGFYDTAAGVSLTVAATLVLFAALIGWSAWTLEKVEEERATVGREQAARSLAEAEGQRAAFLAQVSGILSASLDYQSTLASLARLAVPRLADWCGVSVREADGSIHLLVVSHADASKVELARDLDRRYPTTVDARQGVGRVIRTGKPELVEDLSDDVLQGIARDDEHLALLRRLGFRSSMVVPLIARGGTLGAITFVWAESDRRFGRADLALAEELAHRAAMAADNARLFQAEGKAREEAEAASRAKDAFLATVSHELRTPLSPILAWSRMLRLGTLGEGKARRALETIERCARSQAQLVDDLLDVSRIIAGKLKLDVRPVELAPVVQAAVEVVRPAAEAKGIELQTALDCDNGVVAGDPERLKQVVWNLASNAVKFTPKGGRVRIALAHVDALVRITVTDSGEGIRQDFLPHVFRRFEQADASSTRAHGGLGLGLAIARHIVELHGGKVCAESAGEGQGATFTVELPAATMPAAGELAPRTAKVREAPGQSALPALDGLRVLVVDDEPDSNDVVSTLLSSCGAEVRVAVSAAQALEVLARWQADMLITDIGMPDANGYDLLAKIRSQAADSSRILAVALTAYATRDDRVRALDAGFEAHVAKPVDPAELTAVVANLGRAARRLPTEVGVYRDCG